MTTIGEEIIKIRKKLKLTQEELALKFNASKPKGLTTTRSDVGRYERNECELTVSKYKKFLSLI